MNKLLIAAALAATSFAALADGATYEVPQPVTSTVTRAEVQAQTALAAARGEIVSGEASYVAPDHGRALTRVEVRQALDQARRDGQLVSGELTFVAEAGGDAVTRIASR